MHTVRFEELPREDGSVFITSVDLPLFSVVGSSLAEARRIAKEVARAYLLRNRISSMSVPD